MSFIFDEDRGIDVQSTLDIQIPNQKSKSSDNTNSIPHYLNSCSSDHHFTKGDVEYTGITVGIPSDDYDFIYGRFEKCLGNTQNLLLDFFEESIQNEIENIRNEGDDFTERITLPQATMKKINGMMYFHETKDGEFHPLSLDDFIIMMVDELYEIRRDAYDERGETLSRILGGLDE